MTSTVNVFAGRGSHQSARSQIDVWLAPPALIDASAGWESFDLNPCAQPDQATVLPTARRCLPLPWMGRVT